MHGLTPSSRPNYSSIYAPPSTDVNLPAYHNIYAYSEWKLWLAYSIAILLAAIAVFVGLVAMILNGASYSNNFSTVFRVARSAEINVTIEGDDEDGRDPLPSYLSKAQVRLSRTLGTSKDRYRLNNSVRSPVPTKRPVVNVSAISGTGSSLGVRRP